MDGIIQLSVLSLRKDLLIKSRLEKKKKNNNKREHEKKTLLSFSCVGMR